MHWIWANVKQNFPHWPPKILVPLGQLIFLVATQRTGLPHSKILGLGMLLVLLNETNVRFIQIYTPLNCNLSNLATR